MSAWRLDPDEAVFVLGEGAPAGEGSGDDEVIVDGGAGGGVGDVAGGVFGAFEPGEFIE